MYKIKIFNDVNPITGRDMVWAVRVVEQGDRYGLNDCLENDCPLSMVEFYDTRSEHTDLGQFVTRYFVDTLLKHPGGLCLDGGVPPWTISTHGMSKVFHWLHTLYPGFSYEKGDML